jgi:hypothetical protein
LHHIIKISLIAILLDLFYVYCLFNHHIESETPENFQDIDFEDLEQQQAGFEGKCP